MEDAMAIKMLCTGGGFLAGIVLGFFWGFRASRPMIHHTVKDRRLGVGPRA